MSKSAKKSPEFKLLLEVCQFDEDNNVSSITHAIPALENWWKKNKPVEKTVRTPQIGDKIRTLTLKGTVHRIGDNLLNIINKKKAIYPFPMDCFVWNEKKDRWEHKFFLNRVSLNKKKAKKLNRKERKLQAKRDRKGQRQELDA